MADRIRAGLSPAEGRRFGLTLGMAFLALASLLWLRGHAEAASLAGALGVALVLAGLLLPARLGPAHRAWMGFAAALSRVTTPLFLGLVYFVVVTPLALLRRHLGGNPLRRAQGAASRWVARDRPRGPPGDMERQF